MVLSQCVPAEDARRRSIGLQQHPSTQLCWPSPRHSYQGRHGGGLCDHRLAIPGDCHCNALHAPSPAQPSRARQCARDHARQCERDGAAVGVGRRWCKRRSSYYGRAHQCCSECHWHMASAQRVSDRPRCSPLMAVLSSVCTPAIAPLGLALISSLVCPPPPPLFPWQVWMWSECRPTRPRLPHRHWWSV